MWDWRTILLPSVSGAHAARLDVNRNERIFKGFTYWIQVIRVNDPCFAFSIWSTGLGFSMGPTREPLRYDLSNQGLSRRPRSCALGHGESTEGSQSPSALELFSTRGRYLYLRSSSRSNASSLSAVLEAVKNDCSGQNRLDLQGIPSNLHLFYRYIPCAEKIQYLKP